MRNTVRFLNGFFSTRLLIQLTSQKVLLPFYHTVSDNWLPHIGNLYPVRNKKLFEADLDYLCTYFRPVSMDDLFEIVSQDKPVSKPVMHLTFDDGLKEIYTIVAPLLEKKGIPATFFVNTGFIDNQDIFYRYKVSLLIDAYKKNRKFSGEIASILHVEQQNHFEIYDALSGLTRNDLLKIDQVAKILEIDFQEYLIKEQPYLNTSQVFDLLKKGYAVGSHSVDHPLFKTIPTEDQKNQVAESFIWLKSKFNLQHYYFSFPFSDEEIGKEFFNWLYGSQNCRLSFGISGLKRDFCKYHLHRIPLEGTLRPARDIIKAEYIYFLMKALINKNDIQRT
ncbi:MAG: polysaccharide deacetylase family protein [Bacteroidales bacterium]